MFCKNKKEFGLIAPDYKDIRDFKIANIQGDVVLPESYCLKESMTSIQRQHYGTCTSHAVDGVAEYLNSLQYGKEIKLSQKFIYYNTKVISGLWGIQGDYLRNAIKSLCKFGTPLESDYPDIQNKDWQTYIKQEPSNEIYKKALEYKGKSYWSVNSTPNGLKQSFYQNKRPLAIGCMWYSEYNKTAKDGKLSLPVNQIGGHAFSFVGWEKDKLWFRNSWGINYGQQGYFYIPESEFNKHEFWNAWVILDEEPIKPLEGWVVSNYIERVNNTFELNDIVKTIDRLNIREEPSTSGMKIDTLDKDKELEILEGPIKGGKYQWYKVKAH